MHPRILRALVPPIAGVLVAASSSPLGAQESAARFDAPVVLLPETENIDGFGGPGGAPGAGSIDIPWVLDPAILGASFFKQVGILDLAAPQAISIRNGLLVTVGG